MMTNESAAYKLAMEHLRNCPQGVKTTALGDVLGVSMSTVHRILNLAEDEGDAHVAVPRGHSGGKGGWTPSVWKAGPGPHAIRPTGVNHPAPRRLESPPTPPPPPVPRAAKTAERDEIVTEALAIFQGPLWQAVLGKHTREDVELILLRAGIGVIRKYADKP